MFSKIIKTVYFHFRIDDIFPNNNICLCGCDHTNNIGLCSSKKKKKTEQASKKYYFFSLKVLNISILYIQYINIRSYVHTVIFLLVNFACSSPR